jgi:hypothetical protein
LQTRKNKFIWGGTAKESIPVPQADKKKLQFLRTVARFDKEVEQEIKFLEAQKEITNAL